MDNQPSAFPAHRTIRSFVRRQGRLTKAQDLALDRHWPQFGLDYLGQPRDFASVFEQPAPLVLEIGFGGGEQLRAAAAADRARNYLGVEVHRPGIGRLLHLLHVDGLHHVRLMNHDAVDVLRHEMRDGSLAEIRILFPDPWRKKRHHKRRLINAEFLELIADKLQAGSTLHLATDWEDYAMWMLAALQRSPRFAPRSAAGFLIEKPEWRIETRFESKAREAGHGVWDMAAVRVAGHE